MAGGEFTVATRLLIVKRDEGRCWRCGVLIFPAWWESMTGPRCAYSIQHRIPRGAGGTARELVASPANGILLCGTGTTDCHGWAESNRIQAQIAGWALSLNAVDVEQQLRRPVYQAFSDRWFRLVGDDRELITPQ